MERDFTVALFVTSTSEFSVPIMIHTQKLESDQLSEGDKGNSPEKSLPQVFKKPQIRTLRELQGRTDRENLTEIVSRRQTERLE